MPENKGFLKKKKKKDESMSKRHRSQPERSLNDQHWNSVKNILNNDSIGL